MPTLINDPPLEAQLIAARQACGGDRFDEVWEGVYMMAPLANNEHQAIVTGLSRIFGNWVDARGLGLVLAGANVSDHPTDWTKNYRVPDVLVFLNGNRAKDRNTHWFCGPGAAGPDMAVEIVSRYDRSREKLDFYSRIGVRELLLIDRDPWQLELFSLSDGQLKSTVAATEANEGIVASQIVPLQLQLKPGPKRPGITLIAGDGQTWTI